MTNKTIIDNHKAKEILKLLSMNDFRMFGAQQIAYIRPVSDDQGTRYEIHRADGEELMTVDTHAVAMVLARQHDLEPVVLH